MARQIDFTQILQDEASFQLVRTNPKLTGNVKMTIDLNDNMWFNSIDANEELSKSIYKRFAIDPNISIPGNLFSFFDSGNTPSEIVFSLNESFDSTKTSSDFKDQYDFSHYFSGVKYLPSRRYEEKLSYFAPIFLKQDVPEYFVIFKINDPLNKPIDQIKDEYPFNKENYLKDLFKKASIIKTFDLRPTTKVGAYLRKHIEDPNFPKSPLEVYYGEDSLTNWNGILYDAGVFGKRGENLYDFYRSSNPLKFFEEFITLGYERNGVIFPNILNLEFIFDDDTSELYDFNRYIGMYVNAIELSKSNIDLDRAYAERGNWENTPRLRREYLEYEDVNIDQNNQNGVILPLKDLSIYLSDFENIFQDKNNMFFNYVTDRYGNLHLPKLDTPYNIDYNANNDELFSAKIRMSDTHLEYGDFFGPGELYIQDKGTQVNTRGFSTAYIKIDSLNYLDGFKIYHPNGSRSDSYGRYELIEGVNNYAEIPNPGDYYIYNDDDNVNNGINVYYFNIDGSNLEIASAITACINGIDNSSFKAYQFNEYIFIKCNVAGNYDSYYKLAFTSSYSYNGVVINDLTGNNLNGAITEFNGGSRTLGNRMYIDYAHYDKIVNNLDNILVKTTNGWSKIKNIAKYSDSITEKNQIKPEDREQAIRDYFEKAAICLELEQTPRINSGDFLMVLKHSPAFGLLSFFPIKDFDFDFYSSEYLNFPEIDLFEHYYIPPGVKKLQPGKTYQVYGNGTISIKGHGSWNSGDIFTLLWTPNAPYSYKVTVGDAIVSAPDLNFDSLSLGDQLWNPQIDQNGELEGFAGFFLLKDPSKIIGERDDKLFTLRDKYLNGIASSEYDFFKENNSTDFALRSKIIPYITKWAIPDGLDSRSNQYRLNTELAFGFNNFSPDHEDRSQNPSNFTHEWYYLESKFGFVDDINTVKLNNSYFEIPFDLNKALTEDGYFIDYFTYTPTFNGEEVGRTQTRYSPINKNNLGVYEAFFKGFKITFKDYIDPNNKNAAGKPEFNPNSNKYEGYKFSCLLKTVRENINDDSTPPIKYRFIEHTDFKFIILLIELNIGSKNDLDDFWSQWRSIPHTGVTNIPTVVGGDLSFLDLIPSTSIQAYDSINGDYRLSFDTVNGIEISNITHTLLYSLKHKKFNSIIDNFSNIRLSAKFSVASAFDSDTNVDRLVNSNYLNYPASFKDEIHVIKDDTFLIGRDNVNLQDRIFDVVYGFTPQHISKLNIANIDSVSFTNPVADVKLITASTNAPFQNLPASGLPDNFINSFYSFKIMKGGELYFETLFEKLSFGEFKEIVNNQNPFIEYETYSFDGTTLISKSANWYAEIPDVPSLTKVDAIVANIDSNRPSNLAFTDLIGYTYSRTQLDNSYDINRYEGGFSPLFKDIFIFNSKFNFNKNDIESLDLSNTKFNIDVNDFMTLNNFSHIKIANTKILDLESNEEFEPKYEIVNEISINRKPYDLLTSNWDYGFHHLYSDKISNSPVSGTLRIEEDDSFISKIIKLRDVIELENFDINIVKNTKFINIDDYEIVYQENDNTISGLINIKNALISYLISDGILTKFNEFLIQDPTFIGNYETIEDYVKDYIELNIAKLYEAVEIEFYSKENKQLISSVSAKRNIHNIEFKFLNDKERFEQGYKLERNLLINKLDRFTLNFEFTKSIKSGTLISPKIKMKFI